jgi:hypothetical protein
MLPFPLLALANHRVVSNSGELPRQPHPPALYDTLVCPCCPPSSPLFELRRPAFPPTAGEFHKLSRLEAQIKISLSSVASHTYLQVVHTLCFFPFWIFSCLDRRKASNFLIQLRVRTECYSSQVVRAVPMRALQDPLLRRRHWFYIFACFPFLVIQLTNCLRRRLADGYAVHLVQPGC